MPRPPRTVLSIIIALGLAGPALAQAPSPDTPANLAAARALLPAGAAPTAHRFSPDHMLAVMGRFEFGDAPKPVAPGVCTRRIHEVGLRYRQDPGGGDPTIAPDPDKVGVKVTLAVGAACQGQSLEGFATVSGAAPEEAAQLLAWLVGQQALGRRAEASLACDTISGPPACPKGEAAAFAALPLPSLYHLRKDKGGRWSLWISRHPRPLGDSVHLMYDVSVERASEARPRILIQGRIPAPF